jgi:hypothetical protein
MTDVEFGKLANRVIDDARPDGTADPEVRAHSEVGEQTAADDESEQRAAAFRVMAGVRV